jgi:serine/threonine-protein kinase RsbW
MLTEPAGQQQGVDAVIVQLDIPASGDLLTLARLTAATLAARSAFTVEEVEDLRLAVDELCLPLLRACSSGRLRLHYIGDDGAVRIECTLVPDPDWRPSEASRSVHPEDALSVSILDALVDAHGPLDPGSPAAGHWLVKRREALTD